MVWVVADERNRVIAAADRIVFPGVGAAGSAMENLKSFGLAESVRDAADLNGKKYGAIILAVAHRQFQGISLADFRDEHCVVFDVKSILPREEIDGRL